MGHIVMRNKEIPVVFQVSEKYWRKNIVMFQQNQEYRNAAAQDKECQIWTQFMGRKMDLLSIDSINGPPESKTEKKKFQIVKGNRSKPLRGQQGIKKREQKITIKFVVTNQKRGDSKNQKRQRSEANESGYEEKAASQQHEERHD
jgi:hypothetical protein